MLLFWEKFTNFFDITNWKKPLLDTFKRLNIPPSLQISCPYLLVCSNCRMKNHVQLLLVKCSRWLIHLVQYSLTQLAIWKDQQLAVSFLFSSQMKEPTRLVSQSTTLCQSQIMCNYKLCRGWYRVHYQPLLWSTCHNRFWLKNLRATWWLHFSPSEISMETMAQQVSVRMLYPLFSVPLKTIFKAPASLRLKWYPIPTQVQVPCSTSQTEVN